VVEDGMLYLCMSEREASTRLCFLFLEHVKREWMNEVGEEGYSGIAFQFNNQFSPILADLMDRCGIMEIVDLDW